MVVTWCHIWAVHQMFQDFPLEVQQELLGDIGTVLLSYITYCRAFAFNCSSVVTQYVSAMIAVRCCMKCTNSTPLWCQNVVGHHFPSRHYNLKLLQLLEPRIFPLHACPFCVQDMVMTTDGILLQE